jgi:AbrB family looped-hinge helix DNA binding protein
MEVIRTKVTQGGRIVIPADMRRRLGIEVGEDVNIALDGESLRILTQKESIRRAQALVQKFVPKGVSLVDELIADRRQESANE